ncbi:proline and serine-rich protein 2 [Notechis scutatus]|uniref:Proline and serine-rich protein 2 n=1 Tax=Notechis scutatus TaxID=8663 RepID=A0A6J1V2H6_9SAUR|nr:proline and serine-rich protein 2 [Notechis scutatus]
MPRNMVSDYSGMGYEIPSEVQFGNLEKPHPLESGKALTDQKHSILDEDEWLKDLTHEEKDVLLFFEETIDSLNDDVEEQGLHDSGVFCHSLKLVEENTPNHSGSEELIELVPSAPKNSTEPASEETWKLDEPKLEDVEPSKEDVHPVSLQPTPPSPPPLPVGETYPAQPTILHPKLLHSIPTPLLIAEKLSEQQTKERNAKEGRTISTSSTLCSGEQVKPCAPPPAAPKPQRFPSNISFTNASEREFSKIISKAAVNVQQRKAQVLANVNASALLLNELGERLQKRGLLGPSQSLPLHDLPSESMGHEPLSSLSLVEKTLARAHLIHPLNVLSIKGERPEQGCGTPDGYQNIHEIMKKDPNLLPTPNKTMTVKPEADLVDSKSAWPSISGQPQQDLIFDMQRKLSSLPKTAGLQSKGVTVQFSSRGSTEEARREALRKLGLLK